MSKPLSLRPDYGESDAALPRGEESSHLSASRVAERFRERQSARSRGMEAAMSRGPNPLDGLPKGKATKIVQKTLYGVDLKGIFRDEYWTPINAIWKAFDREGFHWGITHSQYESENGKGEMPVRKVWTALISFENSSGRDDGIVVRVVAAGAGSVKDPLDAYDVTATAF